MSSSMIRKITRGTGTATSSGVTISCSISNVDKVMVILDAYMGYGTSSGNNVKNSAAGGGVYLKSVSTTEIVIVGRGVTKDGNYSDSALTTGGIAFSYQIIECM